MPTLGQQQINIGPNDLNLSVSLALPAANATNTTGILDLQSIAPNGDAWRLGRIAVVIPAIVGHVDTTKNITFALKAAPPSLTGGATGIAPLSPVPGAFVTPICAQTISIPGVAFSGSPAQVAYFTLAFDANGSPFQFYEFVQTVSAGDVPNNEVITYAWQNS